MATELGPVVDALPGLVWTALPDGQIDFMNQGWSASTGLAVDASYGRGWQVAVHPEDLPRLLAGWRGGPTSGAPIESEVRLRGSDGNYRWFLFRAHPSADASGQVVKWCGMSIDIDDRMQAAEARRARERRFRLIVDELPVLLSTATPDGELEEANRHYLEYFGATLEELKGRETVHSLHPDDRARVLPVRKAAIDAGRPYEIECRRQRADGVYRWFCLRAFPLRDADGRIALWYRLQTDIDEQKRAEALLAGEKLLLEMVASGRPMSDILAALCRLVDDTASGYSCGVVLVDPTGTKLQETIAPSLAAEFNESMRGWPLDRIGGPCVMAARDKVQVIMSDVASDTRWRNSWRKLAQAHGLRSCWSTPIVSQAGKALGTFALYSREPGSPDPSQLELIAQFSNIASIAIERAQRDEALRQSEARRAEAERELQLTIDMIPAKVATYEPDGTRSFVNRQWRNYIEAAGDVRSIVRHFHPDDSERAKRAWRNSLATGQPLSVDMRIRRADGEYRWHTHHCVPLCDEQGTILKWYAAEVDIEDKKRAENALLRSEARIAEAERELRLTLDSIPTITWRAGADGYVQQLNKRWFEYTGTTPQQVRGWRWKLCIHPDDLDRLVDTGNEYVATGKSIDGEARVRRHDGTYRWFLFRPAPVRDETGKVVGWYGAITDIEDRKRAEERAVEAERELQRTIDHIPVLVGTYAADGSRLFANKRGREFTGLSAGDVAGRRWKIAIHPDDLEREESKWRECIASGEPFELEYRMRASDGTYRWHMTRRVPLRDAAGKVIRWYGTGYDIEDRKRAEEALRRSETFLAEGQRISSTGTFSWRVDTDELTFSEELYRIFELDLGAAVTFERVFALVHPEDMRLLSERMKRIRVRDGSIEQEIRLLMPDGRVKYLRTIGQMADHQDGRPEYLGAIQDVTQRRLAEEALDKVRSELAHVTRVMSFSALTASIAHEVNQPLAGIVTNASTCLRMLAADPPNVEGARETARRTIRDGNRAADVISRLRALFSKRAATTEAVDLNEAAREILTLVSTDLLRSRISLRAELGSEPLLVTGDRVQLQQVILNLVRNALDAMSGVDDRPRSLLVKTYEEEDERARLTVKDVGAGFEPQGVERLFDVFYTTKSGGMGIGLSVSRSIIENHGGRLWAEANDGPGATFSFSIPRQAENARHDSIGEAAWTPNISAEHDVMRNA